MPTPLQMQMKSSLCLPSSAKPPQPPPSPPPLFSPPNTTPISSSPAKPNKKSLLQGHPLYGPAHANLSLQIKEKILCLEILGVDAGKALSRNPSLRSASLHSIDSVLSFLRSKGIRCDDLPKILGMCPTILTADIASGLGPVFDFLSADLRVPDCRLRRVVNKNPRLLASSARDQLRPALFYLNRLGLSDLDALAYRDSVLLVSSVERTLIPKFLFLESELGLGKEAAEAMVRRCPALFTFSVERNFRPKTEFLVEEMGRKEEEVREFPQYFTFSLEKRIKPRHTAAAQAGLQIGLPLLLKSTEEEFSEFLSQADR